MKNDKAQATNIDPAQVKAAEFAAWEAAVSGTLSDLKNMKESEDANVKAAFEGLATGVAALNDSQLSWGERVLQRGRRNQWVGNLMAASEVGSHVRNAYSAGAKGFGAGKWVFTKVGGLIG